MMATLWSTEVLVLGAAGAALGLLGVAFLVVGLVVRAPADHLLLLSGGLHARFGMRRHRVAHGRALRLPLIEEVDVIDARPVVLELSLSALPPALRLQATVRMATGTDSVAPRLLFALPRAEVERLVGLVLRAAARRASSLGATADPARASFTVREEAEPELRDLGLVCDELRLATAG
jgi:hypothetical protein